MLDWAEEIDSPVQLHTFCQMKYRNLWGVYLFLYIFMEKSMQTYLWLLRQWSQRHTRILI